MTDKVPTKPYKGSESYQAEDARLFFGRDREADRLLALILEGRTTVFYAPSGAGKTSLLNARVIPGLEAAGHWVVRMRPGKNPLLEAREAAVQSLLCHPRLEARAIERACQALAEHGETLTVAACLARYDALASGDPRDDRLRQLVAPMVNPPLAVSGLTLAAARRVMPAFCRLLRSSIDWHGYVEQLASVLGTAWAAQLADADSVTLPELIGVLEDDAAAYGHQGLLAELAVPTPGLAAFFRQICEVLGTLHDPLSIVLIVDQFEELFTLFYDPGPGVAVVGGDAGPPEWQLRYRFFDQLAAVYAARWHGPPGEDLAFGERPLPIRLVISMRQEYYGELGPLRAFIHDLDDRAYRLGLLERQEAGKAIRQPALLWGYDYEDDCYREILARLTKEERFVEPAHIQIVCDKLWSEVGEALVRSGGEARIDLPSFNRLGGVDGILRTFLAELLDEREPEDRREILDMLDQLITGGGTRNIVELRALVAAPFRDAQRRERLVRLLSDRTVVRIEPRLGGEFVEVTHEFLIAPVLEAIERLQLDRDYRRLQHALSVLIHGVGRGFQDRVGELPSLEELKAVHDRRDSICWTAPPPGASRAAAVELMLRTAVARGASADVLSAWMHRYEDAVEGKDRVQEGAELLVRGEVLARDQWRALDSVRSRVPATRMALLALLRTALLRADSAEKASVAHWTREALRAG